MNITPHPAHLGMTRGPEGPLPAIHLLRLTSASISGQHMAYKLSVLLLCKRLLLRSELASAESLGANKVTSHLDANHPISSFKNDLPWSAPGVVLLQEP